MQRLTEDMSRLCKEISAGRRERLQMMKQLTKYHRGLQRNVGDMLKRIHKANADMFAQSRKARGAFMRDMSAGVVAMRQEFRADRLGARRAWHG